MGNPPDPTSPAKAAMDNPPDPPFPSKAAMDSLPNPPFPSKSYELSGRIMLTAIVVLVSVMIFMVFLHIYARWYLLRVRRRHSRRRSRRSSHLVFYVGPDTPISSSPASAARRGLDAAVLGSLPVFLYSDKTFGSLECAVCLSEFEENEKVRLLPKCNHCFHIECIDMWFHSHSTCPLCRSPVELPPVNPSDFVSVSQLGHSEPGSSSGFCATCQHEGNLPYPPVGPSSLGDRRKEFEMGRVMIEVPRRTEFENELETSSPAGRLLSLKKLLSMNRRAVPSAEIGTSRGYPVAELDIESGTDELTQQPTRTPTPR